MDNIIKKIETSDGVQYKIEGQLPVIDMGFIFMEYDGNFCLAPQFAEPVFEYNGYTPVSPVSPKSSKTLNSLLVHFSGSQITKESTKLGDTKSDPTADPVYVDTLPSTEAGIYIMKGSDLFEFSQAMRVFVDVYQLPDSNYNPVTFYWLRFEDFYEFPWEESRDGYLFMEENNQYRWIRSSYELEAILYGLLID